MTNIEGWEQQPGGLLLKVDPYDKNNPAHKIAARHAMRDTINTVSLVHGASLNENGFLRNLRLLDEADGEDPDLLLELHFAKWDVCERKAKAICLGASVGWYTYGFTLDGKLERGHYLEDFAVLKSRARELIRSKPKGLEFPEESLAGCLDRISFKNMHVKDGVMCRYGEVAPDNTAMMRQMANNGANMGVGVDSAVLEYERLPGGLLDYLPEEVEVRPIKWKGVESKRNFIVRWKQDGHDVRFIITKGRATAAGVPRIDIRPWDNGNLPDPHVLEGVVAATLRAIEQEAGKRHWGAQKRQTAPSPLISLWESRPDIHKALFRSNADIIFVPRADVLNSFDAPTPSIHVHIIGQPYMIEAFKESQRRFFGDRPMVPGINNHEARNKQQLIA